ncbi:hypothetical protein AG1IA_09348 [Rhizoctonia solani AG-1 IA]|uniref:Uncharacterized protein n=1 Tax=Thanatephorus cucumeris (strain AG1-IA) TaxID=983506 RepID=L8WJS4_THACA|nr:hypothetical protein AG1IA_09348 [Rhizoctonia solani AG-1 IA]
MTDNTQVEASGGSSQRKAFHFNWLFVINILVRLFVEVGLSCFAFTKEGWISASVEDRVH